MNNSRRLSQYYTIPEYASYFCKVVSSKLDLENADLLLEPSAGSGNIYNFLNPKLRPGIDIDHKMNGIIQGDFLAWRPDQCYENIITIGNPPFGKNAGLAVKFFNHAATFSNSIAFIVPKTFRKESVINRLDPFFHLLHDEDVPKNSFVYEESIYDVWCAMQIWTGKDFIRPKISLMGAEDVREWFSFVTPEQADFSVQRVGGQAGKLRENDFQSYSKQSHYFIKSHHPRVLDIFRKIDFDEVKYNTVSNPSISINELVKLWIKEWERTNENSY